MSGERGDRLSGEPWEPSPLPPELAAFLRDQDIVCLMQGTDQGTVFVIKLSTPDIESARGRVPIHLRHELYAHPNAPVIRTTLCIYDQPEAPLALETFTNIADENQRNDFAALRLSTDTCVPPTIHLLKLGLFVGTVCRDWVATKLLPPKPYNHPPRHLYYRHSHVCFP
jgi:hypothetical protein